MSKDKASGATGAIVSAIVILLLVGALSWGGYQWFCCRIYVPSGHMAIVTAKTGKTPAPGQILVERGEKGIWKDVLSEGRHFLDPIRYDVEIVPATLIPLGKVGIVTSKVGRELPSGEILAEDRDCKGIWRDVLGPGLYRLNPEGYSIEITDAINIPAGYVGVVTSQTGELPSPGAFAKPGQKGVLKDVLQPGLYYINRYAYKVNVIEIGMNQVTMTSNKGESVFNAKSRLNVSNSALQELESNTLQFQKELRKQNQSSDLRQLVSSAKFTAPPRNAPIEQKQYAGKTKQGNRGLKAMSKKFLTEADCIEMPVMNAPTYASDAPDSSEATQLADISEAAQIFGISKAVEFPSRDGFKVSLEMTVEFELLPENIAQIYLLYGDLPQVVEKIIMPQVLSISRLKGSSYGAQDFIMGEGRENFQKDLQEELAKTLATKSIIVHNAIIRTVDIPMDILQPIRAVSLAQEQDKTNVALQETAKKLGELNTETELIEQRRREVRQETEKLVAMTAAESRQEVAGIEANAALKVAEINVKRSEILAQIATLKGETDVKVKFLTANETAQAEVKRAAVLQGTANLCWLRAVEALSPKVETRVIYAGPGTLWTDLKNAAINAK